MKKGVEDQEDDVLLDLGKDEEERDEALLDLGNIEEKQEDEVLPNHDHDEENLVNGSLLNQNNSEEEPETLLDTEKGDADIRIKPGRSVVVEPLIFLFCLSGKPVASLVSQYQFDRIAEDMNIDLHNHTGGNFSDWCTVDKSNPAFVARQTVQRASANLNTYMSLGDFVPTVTMVLVYGAYSDRMGRRLPLILSCFGSLFEILFDMVIIHFRLSVDLLILSGIGGFIGGQSLLLATSYAYIADYVPREKRPVRIAFIEAVLYLNAGVGPFLVGYLIQWQGFFKTFYFILTGKVLAVLYAVFFIPETVIRRNNNQRKTCVCSNTFTGLKESIELFTKDDGTKRRWQLLTLGAAYVAVHLLSPHKILTLFEKNAPLCWNSVQIGHYRAISETAQVVCLVLSPLVLKRIVSVEWQTVIALISDGARLIFWAFVTSTVMMYLGKLFSVLGSVNLVTGLFDYSVGNQIYASTLFIMEGFVFLCMAFCKCVALSFMLYYTFRMRGRMISSQTVPQTEI